MNQPAPQQPQQPQQPVPPYGQPQYPAPYPPQYGQPYPMQPKTNTMAILSLVFAFLMPILGVILGFISLNQIKDLTRNEKGKGLATAGIIIGFVYIGIAVLVVVFSMIFTANIARYY